MKPAPYTTLAFLILVLSARMRFELMALPTERRSPGFERRFDRLTERERVCLRALREFGEAKSAARSLNISVTTFNTHTAKARQKLGVGRSWDAARLAAEYEALINSKRDEAPATLTMHNEAGLGPVSDVSVVGGGVDAEVPGGAALHSGLASKLNAGLESVAGKWRGPIFVVATSAGVALAAVIFWAVVEIALRVQQFR